MKHLSIITTMFFFTAILLSCSDDNESKEIQEKGIVGEWILIQSEGYEIYNDEKDSFNETFNAEERAMVFTCHNDGRFSMSNPERSGTWYIKSNLLCLIFDGESAETIDTILELTSTRLVLEYSEKYSQSELYEKNTFIKQIQ